MKNAKLLSKLASEGHLHLHAFYEWVNPITDQPDGSFPFRTGILGIRTAIADILEKVKKTSHSSYASRDDYSSSSTPHL